VLVRPLAIRDSHKMLDRLGDIEILLTLDASGLAQLGSRRVDGCTAQTAGGCAWGAGGLRHIIPFSRNRCHAYS
jgi:hypothetical protein